MKFLSFLFVVLFSVSSFAGDNITKKDLKKFRLMTQSKKFKTKQNTIANNSLNSLSIDMDHLRQLDRNFTHIVKRGIPTNQQRSGRCWLFAGFNMVRYYAELDMKVKHFEFSENYLFFFHKLELANYLLNEAGLKSRNLNDHRIAWLLRHGLGDGGYWDMFTALLEKYGAVPESAMPETKHSSSTGELNKLFGGLVKRHVAVLVQMRRDGERSRALFKYKDHAMTQIYQFLALTLGTPPESFQWRRMTKGSLTEYAKITPKEFYEEFVEKTIESKIHLMSDPSLKYYQKYILSGLKNVSEKNEAPFLNVPHKILEESTQLSIILGHPVWFGADVGKYADFEKSLLDTEYYDYSGLFGFPVEGNKSQRLQAYASAPTHAMVIFGMDLVGENPVKWLVENSWGVRGKELGYLIMTNDWMKEYVFDVVVEKEFVPFRAQAALLDDSVVELPIWHHLWQDTFIK